MKRSPIPILLLLFAVSTRGADSTPSGIGYANPVSHVRNLLKSAGLGY